MDLAPTVRHFGTAENALGRAIYRLRPEDRHDRQPLHSPDGATVLIADLRLDHRDDLLTRLGIADRQAELSDADICFAPKGVGA